MTDALIFLQAATIGLVAGGITVSGYRLATQRHPSFQLRRAGTVTLVGEVLVLAVGGPLVMMRNAIRGRLIEGRPLPFVAASAMIAGIWCYFSGSVLVGLIPGLAL